MHRRLEMQRQRQQLSAQQMYNNVNKPSPMQSYGRQAFFSNPGRFSTPSFRSQYFNCGEGLLTVNPGETVILAKKTVPAQHGGVWQGFLQFFNDCSCNPEIVNSITWGLRINGMPIHDFSDFIGQFSTPGNPCQVYFPLAGGAQTLGTSSLSPGGSDPLDSTPTCHLQATNNWSTSVVLQARIIGYTFPISERDDEFANI